MFAWEFYSSFRTEITRFETDPTIVISTRRLATRLAVASRISRDIRTATLGICFFNASGAPGYSNMALLARASGNTFQFSNNCFYKLSQNCVKFKLQKKIPCRFASCGQSSVNARSINTGFHSAGVKNKKYLVFDDAVSFRRDQAQRSLLVQVQSEQSSYELYNYCSQFGKVQEMHHYTINGSVHFILIEFKSLADMDSLTSVLTHMNIQEHLPVTSPMVWFRATNNGSKKGSFSKNTPLTVVNGKAFPTSETINDWLLKAESISEQMTILFNSTKLNDTDTRLRFLTARQIETCLSGMFSNIAVLPFGSSVNGFGKHGCDLDLVLKMQGDDKDNTKGRLIYHTKAGGSNDRVQAQKVMETISDLMQQFLPGIARIRRILKARVPIIKYNQTLTGLECDLSMTNTIGTYMSELLYLYGEIDWRVRPLTFTIRMWANCVQLTNSSPGSWITNFSLTLLVLFYLQQRQILPSLQQLVKFANKDDIRIADGCVDCTFLRDISRLPKPSKNNEDTLEELLINFFIYYSSFDFSTKAVSLNVGTPVPKPEDCSVFIYNPLEQGLNVTKNMNIQETERLKVEMRNAAWLLDSAGESKTAEWGLLSLFQQIVQHSEITSLQRGSRMLDLSTLFKKLPNTDDAPKDSKDTESTSVNSGAKNKSSTVSKNVDRQGASNAKTRTGQRQEWRR